MSEAVYNIIQFGRQANIATAVATTTLFPADAGFLGFNLDRAADSPDEDFGSSSREQPSRESYGVRLVDASMPFTGRYQDLMHVFEMHAAGTSGTPTGTASPFTYTYTWDETSDSLKNYTVEYGVAGSTQDEWRAYGVIATDLEFGFDALTAPGNSMWKGTLSLIGVDRSVHTITPAISAPTALETMEGHLTTLSEGPVGTAFASLSALTGSLKQFSWKSNINAKGRAYGGATDTLTAYGRSGKGELTFDALIGINATSKTDTLDIYNVSGGLATERRWRLTTTGSGVNVVTQDFRVRFRAVNVGDHEGERLYAVNGVMVRDATLGGRGQVKITNAVTSIP